MIGLLGVLIIITIIDKKTIGRYLDIIVVYSIIIVLFAVRLLSEPSVRVWISRDYGIKYMFFVGGIFAYAVIRIQNSPEQMLKSLTVVAIVLGLYYSVQVLEPLRNGYWTIERFGAVVHDKSNMSWSYGVLFVISILLANAILYKKLILYFPVGVGLIGILLYGSRGTIVCFAIGILLLICVYNRKMDYKKILLLLTIGVFALFLFSECGATSINNFTKSIGWDSRLVDTYVKMVLGNRSLESESSGRDRIWKLVIRMIKEKPYGYGLMGHRTAIYNIGIKWGYSHDFFLDILAEYGVIDGGLIILCLAVGFIRYFIKRRNNTEVLIMIVFIMVSCEMLLSAYYWIHYGLWAMFALYMNRFQSNWSKVTISMRIKNMLKE